MARQTEPAETRPEPPPLRVRDGEPGAQDPWAVFGINRRELVRAVESVYGAIDAGTYLRRFFDMEFVLPEPDPGRFSDHLVERYGLVAFLASHSDRGSDDLPGAAHMVPFLLGTMGALPARHGLLHAAAVAGRARLASGVGAGPGALRRTRGAQGREPRTLP